MGELGRLSLLWEEAWHSTLSELQVGYLSEICHPMSILNLYHTTMLEQRCLAGMMSHAKSA